MGNNQARPTEATQFPAAGQVKPFYGLPREMRDEIWEWYAIVNFGKRVLKFETNARFDIAPSPELGHQTASVREFGLICREAREVALRAYPDELSVHRRPRDDVTTRGDTGADEENRCLIRFNRARDAIYISACHDTSRVPRPPFTGFHELASTLANIRYIALDLTWFGPLPGARILSPRVPGETSRFDGPEAIGFLSMLPRLRGMYIVNNDTSDLVKIQEMADDVEGFGNFLSIEDKARTAIFESVAAAGRPESPAVIYWPDPARGLRIASRLLHEDTTAKAGSSNVKFLNWREIRNTWSIDRDRWERLCRLIGSSRPMFETTGSVAAALDCGVQQAKLEAAAEKKDAEDAQARGGQDPNPVKYRKTTNYSAWMYTGWTEDDAWKFRKAKAPTV